MVQQRLRAKLIQTQRSNKVKIKVKANRVSKTVILCSGGEVPLPRAVVVVSETPQLDTEGCSA